MKFKKLNESFDIGNKMTIRIGSGLNADGCIIKVTDEAGNILHQEEYSYGYNASYNRKHADWAEKDYQNAINNDWKGYSRKPFIGDIIDELCAQYDIDKDSIEYVKGKNVFKDTDVSDDQVSNFISLLNECKSTTDDEDSDDLNEGITDSVKSAARAIAPKLKSIVNHLPEIIQGLDLVKDFYDELPEDNAVKTYLDGKGAKDVEDVYSALSGLYRIIKSSIPEHTPEKVESPSITEDLPAQEHYIVGITTDGSRMYYNKELGEFREDIDEATIYPDKDSAMEDWFNIPRRGFKRIFVPIYERNRLTEGAGATVVREVTDALSKVVKSDPKKLVATTTKVVDAVEDKDIDNVFDMMVKKVKDIPLPKDTIEEIRSVIGGDIDLSECTNLKTILDLMDTKKLLKENPEAAKSILMIVLTAISIIEPTPVGEVITFILGLLPDKIVAGIMQATQILNPVSAVVSGVNAAVNK